MSGLSGKVAIVTGASSGIGKATVLALAAEGARVVVADLNTAAGEAVAHEAGGGAIFHKTDVTCEADVEALVARTTETFGRLDILVNNAGIPGARGPLEDISLANWDRTVGVCLTGVFLGMKHAIVPMRKAGGGAIVSTSSLGGLEGLPDLHPYCAAKAAVINLTRSTALQLARDRIRVNCVAPGGLSTPMFLSMTGKSEKQEADDILSNAQPWPSAGQPADVASTILFLVSDGARFITGHTIVVDGGAHAGKASVNRPLAPAGQFTGASFEELAKS